MGDTVSRWLRSSKAWQGAGGLLVLLLVIFYLAGGFNAKVRPGVSTDPTRVPLPAGARTERVTVSRIRPTVEVVGTVRSVEHVNLSSRVNAYVAKVAASAGDRVRKGQLLIELDDRALEQQRLAAEADLARAEAEYRRTEELFATEAATRRQLDVDEAAYRGAQARLEEIRVLLSHTRIVSPTDGVVVDRGVETGDLATVGTVLLTVYDPGRMRLEAPVPLRLTDKLHPGDELDVELAAGDGVTAGVVAEIVAAVDAQSRTRLVKVLLPGISGQVVPGMFGRLLVPGEERSAILIPASAVYRVGQLAFVEIAQEGTVVRRAVRLGGEHADKVEILAGLTEGDVLVLEPLQREG